MCVLDAIVQNRWAPAVKSPLPYSQCHRVSDIALPCWFGQVMRHEPLLFSPKIDTYSFGMVLYELITRRVPFEGLEWQQILMGVANDEMRYVRTCLHMGEGLCSRHTLVKYVSLCYVYF